MHLAMAKNDENFSKLQLQLEFGVVDIGELRVLNSGGRVSVFYGGFCFCRYKCGDKFSRNYCLVQLHLSFGMKLKSLSEVFDLQYQYCSRIVSNFKKLGVDGIKDRGSLGCGRRLLIDKKVGQLILELRKEGKSYEEISKLIQKRFRRKLRVGTLRTWVCEEKKQKKVAVQLPIQKEMDISGSSSAIAPLCEVKAVKSEVARWNIYSGIFILYSMFMRSGLLESFRRHIKFDEKRPESWGVERVLLTLFFLNALRCRSVEQGKHLLGEDFEDVVGGDFLRLQSLRYAIDKIVSHEGYESALGDYHRNLFFQMSSGKLFYTDGHFSTYYGKRRVPKGYDPRRQMPYRGRNTIYLHNAEGENVYLFESPTNTTLSNDMEVLVGDMEKFGVKLKGKTMCFDRGGFSQKCFKFLRSKKLYLISYLKNRKSERLVEEGLFEDYEVEMGSGELLKLKLFEKEPKDTKYGKVRTIIMLDKGKQVPILTTNPYMKLEEVILVLKQRWREENCFKYMIEHFGIDLLTTYKTEEAPDKVIERPHPARKEINKQIKEKKREYKELQAKLGQKVFDMSSGEETVGDFNERESELTFKIKNIQVDIDCLERKRKAIPTKQKRSLKEDHVLIAGKRRLLINIIKAMNYNCEKWLQDFFKEHHTKKDETLSLVRSLFRQPGRVIKTDEQVRVELKPLDNKLMRQSLDGVLEKFNQNGSLKYFDGRNLTISQMQ